MSTVGRLVAIAVLLAPLAAARGDAGGEARKLFESGVADYAAGRYAEALRQFQAGWERVPNPKFLLNIGQTYRKLGRLDEARASLLEYMGTLAADDPRRVDVARVVAEIDLEIHPAPAAATAPAATVIRRGPSPTVLARLRLAGAVLLPLGGALAVIGGALVGVAARDDALIAHPAPGATYDPALYRERDAFSPAGLSLLGVGAALAATGVVLVVYARKR